MKNNGIATIDAHCFNFMMRHIRREISYRETDRSLQNHRDEIIVDIVNSICKLKYVYKSYIKS